MLNSAQLKKKVGELLAHPSAPIVFAGAVIVLTGIYLVQHYHLTLPGQTRVVVFDPVKFVNAQRAAASIMAMRPNADTALALTQVAKQAEAVIADEAHGALVIVKQAVVISNDAPDITDAVLTRFGLPTTAPTVTNSASDWSLESVAPTNSTFSQGKLAEDYRLEIQARSNQIIAEDAKKGAHANAVP